MCNHAIVLRAEHAPLWCGTQGELASALDMPIDSLPLDLRYPASARRGDACLCPIDLIALGGRRLRNGDFEMDRR
jgi:hypothetical protein